MKKRTENKIINFVIIIVVAIIAAIYGENIINTEEKNIVITEYDSKFSNIVLDNNLLQIFYFDVGQADSSLILNNGKVMLIDAGNDKDGDTLVKNIKDLGIEKIDYLVGTHMHADHIGGMDSIVKSFEIGEIFIPYTTRPDVQVKELLQAIDEKGLTITATDIGYSFKVGEGNCVIKHINNDEPTNINLSSIVIELEYKTSKYLFMGDAESKNENEINWNKVNVLKVGHHGSDTSSTKKFINTVSPEIAIISVGKNNIYKLPKQTVIDRLENIGAKIYRTDEDGTILITNNGTSNEVTKIKE